MRQKTIVGLIMAAGAALMIAVGGWVMALIVLVLICFGVQEEFHALAQAGHRPVAWPTWVGMIVSIPLTLLIGTKMILPVIMAICLMTMICVIFRSEPKLDDAVLSMLPMLTVALPGMSAISFTHIEPKALQVTLITLMIGIPCMADAFAMWVGKAVKGPKLCPTVSPNKTISGAIGGVVGALLTSILIWRCGIPRGGGCASAAARVVCVPDFGHSGRRCRGNGRFVLLAGQAPLRDEGLLEPVSGSWRNARPPGQRAVHGGADAVLSPDGGHLRLNTRKL